MISERNTVLIRIFCWICPKIDFTPQQNFFAEQYLGVKPIMRCINAIWHWNLYRHRNNVKNQCLSTIIDLDIFFSVFAIIYVFLFYLIVTIHDSLTDRCTGIHVCNQLMFTIPILFMADCSNLIIEIYMYIVF